MSLAVEWEMLLLVAFLLLVSLARIGEITVLINVKLVCNFG